MCYEVGSITEQAQWPVPTRGRYPGYADVSPENNRRDNPSVVVQIIPRPCQVSLPMQIGESAKPEPVPGLTGERRPPESWWGDTNHSPAPHFVIPAEAGIHITIINHTRNDIPRGSPGQAQWPVPACCIGQLFTLARILHEQCEVEVFWVWSDKPGLQGLHGVHDRLFRYDWADFGRTSPNPRCLSTCRGSTRRGSGGVQANGHHTEQLLVRTGTAQQ